ncbi:damage-inducible protein DinB [Paenibacillus lycopersici]|uniref:Damage-inducible protein DinB n=1 Tax=Paenibacillus lycopersici TaxID=2704462 RepID=A0A6C0G2Q6_9BACL|nr:DinB family protein [Paenibacillus lycopersici]QHT62233.1 damage-inducible protein DinB [Paenibacillus lycopersici]
MTTIDGFISDWLSHRKVLHQMLEEVKTEQLDMKPWEKGMTLSGLVLHITGAMSMFANTLKNGEYTPSAPPQAFVTIEELRANVAADTEATEAVLRSIAPEKLEQTIEVFGRSMTGSELLQSAKDHEIHHKGQMFIYLRLAGIEKLPFFIYRG